MAYTEKPYDFLPPGGQFQDVLQHSPVITSTMFKPTKMVVFYSTSGELTTITAPHEGYAGPLWVKAITDFKFTSAGNIFIPAATTCSVGSCYGFIYDDVEHVWYPIGAVNV